MKIKDLENQFEGFKKEINHPEYLLHYGDARCGRIARIGYHNENGGLRSITSYYGFKELAAFMEGYLMAKNYPL